MLANTHKHEKWKKSIRYFNLFIKYILFILSGNSKGYSSNNYERWAANIAANANMEASNSPALKRISSNPSSSSALHTTTSNSNISTGMYYPHHYTGPTSTSSAYSSPYLPRSSRMHHNTISTGGNNIRYQKIKMPGLQYLS